MKKRFIRNYPKDLTSYDLLKTLAVLTMIIDHMGAFFFPDQMGWRVVGRMSMPMWMFLIGYAQTRQIVPPLYWGAGILVVSDIVFGLSVFPLNILVTIMITRLLLDLIMQFTLGRLQYMFMGVIALVILALPTLFFFEYGTQAILFAMFGYMVRNQKKISYSNEHILIFMFVALMVLVFFQKVNVGFDTMETFTMAAGVLLICLMLSLFQPKLYPDLTKKLPGFVVEGLKIMGRQTLEIYVIHLVLFKAAAFWLFPERFGLFQWSFF